MRTIKRDNLSGYTEITNKNGTRAWSNDVGFWVVERDGETLGRFTTRHETMKKEDWSGNKKYRLISQWYVKITVVSSYRRSIELNDDFIFYGGERAAILEVLKMFDSGYVYTLSAWDAENAARKAGVEEYLINLALDCSFTENSDNRTRYITTRMLDLLEKAK